jgi:hypothetical protein
MIPCDYDVDPDRSSYSACGQPSVHFYIIYQTTNHQGGLYARCIDHALSRLGNVEYTAETTENEFIAAMVHES